MFIKATLALSFAVLALAAPLPQFSNKGPGSGTFPFRKSCSSPRPLYAMLTKVVDNLPVFDGLLTSGLPVPFLKKEKGIVLPPIYSQPLFISLFQDLNPSM